MGYSFNPFTGTLDNTGAAVTGSSAVYSQHNYEKSGTYVYVGYEESGGAWYIYRRTLSDNTQGWATGASSYATNWTNRAILTYL